MMKICFISPKAYPLFNPDVKSIFGGAEVQLYLLAKELAKNKALDVHFMVADYGQGSKEIIDGVTLWKSIKIEAINNFHCLRFFFLFNKVNADIYIQRTLTVQSGLISLYCKLINKKYIYMLAHDREADRTHDIYRSILGRISAFLNFKLAHKIIVQNEYQKSNLNYKSTKIKSSILINEHLTNDKEFILWVGRSEHWKQPELFLELANNFPAIHFVMICSPATGNYQLSKAIGEKATAIENISFYEYIPFHRIDSYFQKAQVFVNTSTKEGFPNTFLQAMNHKTPILSLNVDPDCFITTNRCGYLCQGDFTKMSRNLKELLDNQQQYKTMQANAFNYLKQNHDIKLNAEKLLGLL